LAGIQSEVHLIPGAVGLNGQGSLPISRKLLWSFSFTQAGFKVPSDYASKTLSSSKLTSILTSKWK